MFLTIKLCIYAKMNCLKYNFICIKRNLALNNLQRLVCHKTQTIFQLAFTPGSTLTRSGSTCLGPIYGSNRTKLRTYAKQNYLK